MGSQSQGTTSTVDQAVAALGSAAEEAGGGGVQPAEGTGQEQPQQPSDGGSGQDLISAYLEGLDGDVKGIVAERLERFRKDADSNANRKIQELSEKLRGFEAFTNDPAELQPVVDTYLYLMQEPDKALPWIVGELTRPSEEGGFGYDTKALRDPLMEKLGIEQPPSGGEPQSRSPSADGQPAGTTADGPLTRADLERFMEEQRQEEQRRQQMEQTRAQQTEKLNTWTQEALDKFGLAERIKPDSPMRKYIFQQAHELVSTRKVVNPQIAIETAVEQVKNFLDSQNPSQNGEGKQPQPKTANGGSPLQIPEGVDLKDPKQRKALAASRLSSMMNEE